MLMQPHRRLIPSNTAHGTQLDGLSPFHRLTSAGAFISIGQVHGQMDLITCGKGVYRSSSGPTPPYSATLHEWCGFRGLAITMRSSADQRSDYRRSSGRDPTPSRVSNEKQRQEKPTTKSWTVPG